MWVCKVDGVCRGTYKRLIVNYPHLKEGVSLRKYIMKLIDKDAVVAEIERELKNINLNYVSVGSHPSDSDTNKKLQDGISKNLQILLSFINTLEVKEVDLEREIDNWICDNAITHEDCSVTDVISTAKHFFELGLKAYKGE